MTPRHVLSISEKSELSNYASRLAIRASGPGLGTLRFSLGRLSGRESLHGQVALLGPDGTLLHAIRLSCRWAPHEIHSHWRFPGGIEVSQQAWVDGDFAHAHLRLGGAARGSLESARKAGVRLVVEGSSVAGAKLFVGGCGTVLVEEMDPVLKPFALEIAPSVRPARVLIVDGGLTLETDYRWSPQPLGYQLVFDGLPRELTVSAHLGERSELLPAPRWGPARKRRSAVRREWKRACIDDCPEVECPDPRVRDLIQLCVYVNRSNVLQPGGLLPYPFGAPSKYRYPMWWMWDTAFQAIPCAWMRDPTLAFGNLLSHAALQSKAGCIMDAGGALYADTGEGEWLSPEWYDRARVPSTGPCVTGIAVWDVYQKTGSVDFLRRMYPHLVAYESWLREAKPSGIDPDLIAYHSWFDVGWDDSKRWGRTGLGDASAAAGLGWDLPVAPVDANVFFLLLRDRMSGISEVLGDAERAEAYGAAAQATRRAIDRLMWNESKGFYFDLLPDGRLLDIWTPAGFLPLLARIPSEERFHRMRGHLLDPKLFWSRYPLPTVALGDDSFTLENRLWRGGTWGNVNWQVGEGLVQYDPALSRVLLWRTIDLMYRDGYPVCQEYFDPRDGEPKGAPDYGWTTLIMDSILRRVFGISPKGDHVDLVPDLPASWPGARLRHVFVLGTSLDVRYVRAAGSLSVTVKNRGARPVEIRRAASLVRLDPGHSARL